MLENIAFRGQKIKTNNWIYSNSIIQEEDDVKFFHKIPGSNKSCYINIIPDTVGRYSNTVDKNKTKIFEGDLVKYISDCYDLICVSEVKFGKYKQDGSSGEYRGTYCIGFYVEVLYVIRPEWCEDEETFEFYDFLKQQNILEVASICDVIGNVFDNPELIKNKREEIK